MRLPAQQGLAGVCDDEEWPEQKKLVCAGCRPIRPHVDQVGHPRLAPSIPERLGQVRPSMVDMQSLIKQTSGYGGVSHSLPLSRRRVCFWYSCSPLRMCSAARLAPTCSTSHADYALIFEPRAAPARVTSRQPRQRRAADGQPWTCRHRTARR
jgi:hypothetical protein